MKIIIEINYKTSKVTLLDKTKEFKTAFLKRINISDLIQYMKQK